MKLSDYESIIESILFVAGEPVLISDIANVIKMDKATTKAIINGLKNKLAEENRGVSIVEIDGKYQMCSAESCFPYIKDLYEIKSQPKLSPVSLETLAIIAYKQPITRSEIEDIRGVDVSHAVNRLLERNLIAEAGRKDTPGKPILFCTTDEFYKYFGISSKNELPSIESFELTDFSN